jgi:hypothetical protein
MLPRTRRRHRTGEPPRIHLPPQVPSSRTCLRCRIVPLPRTRRRPRCRCRVLRRRCPGATGSDYFEGLATLVDREHQLPLLVEMHVQEHPLGLRERIAHERQAQGVTDEEDTIRGEGPTRRASATCKRSGSCDFETGGGDVRLSWAQLGLWCQDLDAHDLFCVQSEI